MEGDNLGLSHLPKELLSFVLAYLEASELCEGACLVSQVWREEADSKAAWEPRVVARWPFVNYSFVQKCKAYKHVKCRWKAVYFALNSQISLLFAKFRDEGLHVRRKMQEERQRQEISLQRKLKALRVERALLRARDNTRGSKL